MKFFKLSGAGNDFVAFDNRDRALPPDEARPAWLARVCRRGEGVGSDGVLIIETPDAGDTAHVRMRYHNADGGEADMCGNGLRCFTRLAHHLGAAPRQMTVRTAAGLHQTEIIDDEQVRATITDPDPIRHDVAMELDGTVHRATLAHPGVPHVAIDVTDDPIPLDAMDVHTLGRALRHHEVVMPDGANINFFRRDPSGTLHMRTYERGVEAETLACGTGAVTCVVAAALAAPLTSPIDVITRSGLTLGIHFRRAGERFTDIRLEGPAVILFEGELALPMRPH